MSTSFGLNLVNENNEAEVTPWMVAARKMARHSGACMVIIDHPTKTQEIRMHSAGSRAKRAQVDASYLVEPIRGLVEGKGGSLKMTCAKDRHGHHAADRAAAVVSFMPTGDELRFVISPVSESQQGKYVRWQYIDPVTAAGLNKPAAASSGFKGFQ